MELTSGEKVSGEVIRVTANELAIGKAGNYGYEEQVFALERIAHLEVRKESAVSSVVLSSIGVLIIVVIALGVLISASGGIQIGSS